MFDTEVYFRCTNFPKTRHVFNSFSHFIVILNNSEYKDMLNQCFFPIMSCKLDQQYNLTQPVSHDTAQVLWCNFGITLKYMFVL